MALDEIISKSNDVILQVFGFTEICIILILIRHCHLNNKPQLNERFDWIKFFINYLTRLDSFKKEINKLID